MSQTNATIILGIVLVAIVIVIAVIAAVMSQGPQLPYGYPGSYPGAQASTSWCVAGQIASLAQYGVEGAAIFNGMTMFNNQNLCKATLVVQGKTYYFYTNQDRTIWYTTDVNNNILASYATPVPQLGGQPSQPDVSGTIKTALNSLSLTSSEEGRVTSPAGASVYIPAGAVPKTDTGGTGTMVFNIQERTDVAPTFPRGFFPTSKVYEFGPEGFNFELPVKITLPIDAGVDPSSVGGLAYFDTTTQTWVRVPGTVDLATRTVSAFTTHFSLWTTWGSMSWRDSMNEKGGWLKVINSHRYGSGSYTAGLGEEDCRRKPITTSYGVCIKSWIPKNAGDATWWNAAEKLLMAHDQPSYTAESWVPAGTYELVEILSMSEINYDPLYIPCYSKYWRDLGTYTINAGQTKEFTGGSLGDTTGWTRATEQTPPPCWGVRTTSVGTGDVQVTLTWSKAVDLDLYVTDPRSEEIYYLDTESSSGGKLDRDNKCSNFVMGRPENIFWPPAGAPAGTYKVRVHYYGGCSDSGPAQWTVRVVAKGRVSTYSGTLSTSGESQDVTMFTV